MIKNIMQYSIFFYSIMCVNSIKASQVKMPNLLAAGVIPVICYDNGNTTVILGLEKDNEWVQNPYIDAFSGASGFGDSNPLNLAMREFDEEARLCYTVPALNSNIQFLKDNIHTIVISLINDVTFGEKQYGVTYFVKIKPDHKERLFANFESSTQTIKQELSGPSQKSQKDALLEKEALFEFSYPEILESACSSKERKALPQFHSTTQKQASLQSKEIGLRDSLVFILSAIKSENIWDRSSYGVYIIGQTKKIIDNYGAARYTPWNPDKGLKELVYNEVMQDFAIPQQPNAKKTITDTVTSSDSREEAFRQYLGCVDISKTMNFEAVALREKNLFAPDCILYIDQEQNSLSLHYEKLKLDVLLSEDLHMQYIPYNGREISLVDQKEPFLMILSNQESNRKSFNIVAVHRKYVNGLTECNYVLPIQNVVVDFNTSMQHCSNIPCILLSIEEGEMGFQRPDTGEYTRYCRIVYRVQGSNFKNELYFNILCKQFEEMKKTDCFTLTFGEGDSKKSLMIAKEHYKNPLEAVSSLKEDTPAGELKIDQPKINESQQDESEEKKDAESKSGIADSTEQPKKEIVNSVFTKNNLFLFIGSGIGLSVFAYLVYHSGIIGKWR